MGGWTQPFQPPNVSQSTNAAALPRRGEEIEREAVLRVEMARAGYRAWVSEWMDGRVWVSE